MVEAYGLISAAAGSARRIATEARTLRHVTTVDLVTGPYDVVVRAAAPCAADLDAVWARLAASEGVDRLLRCPVARPAVAFAS